MLSHTQKLVNTFFIFFNFLWVSAVPSRDSFGIISLIQRPVNTLFYFFIKKVRTPSIFPEGPHFYPVKTAFFPYLIMSPEDNYDRIASSVKDCGWSDRKSIPPVLSMKTPYSNTQYPKQDQPMDSAKSHTAKGVNSIEHRKLTDKIQTHFNNF